VNDSYDIDPLLEGLDGDEREARRSLCRELLDDGVAFDELRAAIEEGRLALLPIERTLQPPGPRYSFTELAEKSEIEPDFLATLIRSLGLPMPDDESERLFSDPDLEAARTVAGFRAAGLDEDALLETTRVLGQAISHIVAANRTLLGETFVKEGDSEYDVAKRWEFAARELNPELDRVIGYLLRAQQIAQVRTEVFNLAGLGSGSTHMSVAFADLAGFTRLGEQVAADQLGHIAGRLTAMATDIASPPVRLVKMIGDAAMLVSSEPEPLLEAVLDLLEAAEAEGEEFPELRAGIASGEALARGGDWYGQPVNLASRITDRARPGSVVVASAFKDEIAEENYTWSRLPGKKRLKGISEEIALYRVRRPEPEQPSS
jgi:adenylate cyclase